MSDDHRDDEELLIEIREKGIAEIILSDEEREILKEMEDRDVGIELHRKFSEEDQDTGNQENS